jgi:hypothetical protein
LEAQLPLRQLLAHLYVLMPVLDNDKHYWVGDDEVETLLWHGERWLASHPERETVTTRYLEYNVKWESLPAGKFRHKDHRFEWTRAQFQSWAGQLADRFGYAVRFLTVGPEDPVVGGPTQMARKKLPRLKEDSAVMCSAHPFQPR